MKKALISIITKISTAVLLVVLITVLFLNLSTRISLDKINRGDLLKIA